MRVAFVIKCPHSSGLGMTKSRIEAKSNRTGLARVGAASAVVVVTGVAASSAGVGVRLGKVERAVATLPSGIWCTTRGPRVGSNTAAGGRAGTLSSS